MEDSLTTAVVGLTGALVGGIASFATTWLVHRSAQHDHQVEIERAKLEGLYAEFIEEASRLFGDAMARDAYTVSDLVRLYALFSRIRMLASPEVVQAAGHTLASIIHAYRTPAPPMEELQRIAEEGRMDFLIEFGDACRAHLGAWDRQHA